MREFKRAHRAERTWLGIKGESWEYHADSKRAGRRVVALRWLEDNPNTGNAAGDLVVRDIVGDFWRGRDTARQFDERVIPNGTDEDADAYARERLEGLVK